MTKETIPEISNISVEIELILDTSHTTKEQQSMAISELAKCKEHWEGFKELLQNAADHISMYKINATF